MARAIDAVIFDWGGTLSRWIPQEKVAEFWTHAARHIDVDRVEELAGHLVDAEAEVWAQVRGAQRSGRHAEIMANALARHGIDPDDDAVALAVSTYFASWERELQHKADAAPVLAALQSMGLRTALLSNTHWPRSFHEQLLARDGLDVVLDARHYTSEMTHVKPHPIVFKQVLQSLDARPERSVFVGDRKYDDIYGAQSLGMRTVLVQPSPEDDVYDVIPDATIVELTELVGIIDGWLDLGTA